MGSKVKSDGNAELAGTIAEVLPTLLSEGRIDEVLAVVKALVARNEELEVRLANMVQRRFKSNEGVSSAQLNLFLDALQKAGNDKEGGDEDANAPAPAPVDERLLQRADAAAERAREKALAEGRQPKQRPLKNPFPDHLPRVENEIDIPDAQRACPQCGDEREVFGADISLGSRD